ncbi:hypothetical protein [Bacteroides thetaiotaomicron]|uniref:hypothetical protein n=1 Tax=Bacteroides thetaiotaomicron TaxID=818 RepID=UPI0011462257|nr:hypothetical protein [Bacteroides thetaiotaomicron]
MVEMECQQEKQQHPRVHFPEGEAHCHVVVEVEHGRTLVLVEERHDEESRKQKRVENLYQHGKCYLNLSCRL